MRISDWSSDVCSSDLDEDILGADVAVDERALARGQIVGERGERRRKFAIMPRNIEQEGIDAQRAEHLVVREVGAVAIIVRGRGVDRGDARPDLRSKTGVDPADRKSTRLNSSH